LACPTGILGDKSIHLGLIPEKAIPYHASMRAMSLPNLAIPLAAAVVDGALNELKHPRYPELHLILEYLKESSDITLVDFGGALVSALIALVKRSPQRRIAEVRGLIATAKDSDEDIETKLRALALRGDVQRVGAVRLLGHIRDLRAEATLRQLALDATDSIAVRVAALSSMLRADSRKGALIIMELLGRSSDSFRVICRVFLPDGSEERVSSDEDGDFELLIRSCLPELCRMDRVTAESLAAWISGNSRISRNKRRLFLECLSENGTLAEPEDLDFIKVICLLR
jgi:hypothetical protein